MFFNSEDKKPDKKPQKPAPNPNGLLNSRESGWLNSKELEPPK
jgi:hypothetical protein